MIKYVGRSLLLVALVAASSLGTQVHAQPASALGHPLPDGKLAAGTVTVRVVAGSPSSPATGVAVTLTVNGTPREARTDAEGRATFAGLPANATVKATVLDEDKKEIASDEFPVPAQGGARVMLTTKPFTGTGGLPPASLGGPAAQGGMPEARVISGQPRPDGTNLPGTYGVRVTYNNLTMSATGPEDKTPPVGVPVHLVAYGSDDTVKVQTKPTGADGVALFENLDVSGNTSYFALSNLHRGAEVDRLVSVVMTLDNQGGARVVLSGEKQDATTPGVDDYGKLLNRDKRPVAPGKARIVLDGIGQPGWAVTLYDIATMQPIGKGTTVGGPPDPSLMQAGADFNPNKDLPAGTIDVTVKGGAGDVRNPMPDIEAYIVDAETGARLGDVAGKTDAAGKLRLSIPTPITKKVRAVFKLGAKEIPSEELDISTMGMTFDVVTQWPESGKAEVVFDAPPAGKVVFAETEYEGTKFRSLPFETIADAGALVHIFVYPRVLFSFDWLAFVDDQLLAVQGGFEVTNYAWAPYRQPKTDGITIDLPEHYKGAIVAAQNQNEVAVEQGHGFKINRPIPPGGLKFRAGFSMPISRGEVEMNFKLPLGTMRSQLRIREMPGMSVKLPAGLTGASRPIETGENWYFVNDIRVDRGKSFEITIAGFPTEPGWKIWAPRILGFAVLFIVIGGVIYALLRKPAVIAPADSARREKLLDELVALEKRGIETNKDRDRREKLIEELERNWGT